jgi:hypothetical protein
MSDDLVAGCARHLRGDPLVVAAVGLDPDGGPLIVQDAAPTRAEMDQAVAVVVQHAGATAGNDHNTYEQVRLLIEFWADPQRDPDGNLLEPAEARQRMVSAYHAVDRALHRPQGGAQRWGDVATTDSTRLSGLTPYQVPGSDGLWRGTAYYAVGLA